MTAPLTPAQTAAIEAATDVLTREWLAGRLLTQEDNTGRWVHGWPVVASVAIDTALPILRAEWEAKFIPVDERVVAAEDAVGNLTQERDTLRADLAYYTDLVARTQTVDLEWSRRSQVNAVLTLIREAHIRNGSVKPLLTQLAEAHDKANEWGDRALLAETRLAEALLVIERVRALTREADVWECGVDSGRLRSLLPPVPHTDKEGT